jgi:hypothetical protein
MWRESPGRRGSPTCAQRGKAFIDVGMREGGSLFIMDGDTIYSRWLIPSVGKNAKVMKGRIGPEQ